MSVPVKRTAVLAAALTLTLGACATVQEDLAEPVVENQASSVAGTTSVSSAASEAKPDCSNKGVRDSGFGESYEALFCQDDIARIGVPGTDASELAKWNGRKWVPLELDGGQCYTQAKLDSLGVPNSLRVNVCEGKREQRFDEAIEELPGPDPKSPYITVVGMGEAGEQVSYPRCDGRSILILDSVIDDSSDTQFKIAQQVLVQDPTGLDRKYTVPGQCPSLRAQLDGNDIYPVYLDFGDDTAGMCAAKAKYGGNGRVLSNTEEYVDPC